jgi:beta-glucosidase
VKKPRVFPLLILLVTLSVSTRGAAQSPAQVTPETEKRVEELLSRMTLEEKLGQLVQYTPAAPEIETKAANGAVGCIFNTSGAEQINPLQRQAVEKSRLKIPILFAHDVIHGYRTIFPIPLGIASTWDPSLAELSARVAAREARAAGIHWTFAPMVDIARDPRWGRIAEGSGEDPVLGAAMASAYVRGFQGTDLRSGDSVLACAKHFAAYGAAEAGRDYNTTDMSERTLREVYLPPFHAAVNSGVWTLMTAFNALNGVPATGSRYLMNDILRGEWNFRGFVDSDYNAVEQLVPHGVAATPADAALIALRAGVDMNMVDGAYLTLGDALRKGRVEQREIDEAVRRVLRAKFVLGLFEQPYVDEAAEKRALLTSENLAASRRVAQNSIVLLKNEGGLLPLSKKVRTLALIGPLADSKLDMLGSWSAAGKAEEAVTILEGVRAAVSPQTRVVHAAGTSIMEGTDEEIAEAVKAANGADLVLLAIGEAGRMTGEANSRVSLDLPGRQQELLERVAATGKPVVAIIMSGRPLAIEWAAEHVQAILWPWFPGTTGGHAIADVLFGEVSPSAKLPVTFPRSVGQIPIYHAHLPTGRPEDPEHRYTSKYIDSPNSPLYPFGYGLSYTTFRYGDLQVTPAAASATVTNTGNRKADEIVQLYLRDPVASVSRPVKELKDFRRITLAAGESRRVEFAIRPEMLRFWSDEGWKTEPGTFHVWIGPSSAEGLQGEFVLE